MLEGVDKNWILDEGRGKVSYAALAPGTYRLRLQGTNSQGVRSKGELVATIVVIPALWQRWWFQPSIAFVFLVLFSGFTYQRRMQRLRFNRALRRHD